MIGHKLVPALACTLFCLPAMAAEPALGDPWNEPTTGMRFIWIPGGCFDMGAADGEDSEKPVHKVCVRGFYLGVFEVTQAEYRKVLGNNPSNVSGTQLPVESVTWVQATQMAQKLSQAGGATLRLPSEAEWEYACRAGGQHALYCGEGKANELARFYNNSNEQPWPVGGRKPNAWGLYDMSGNVWEWTQDCWHQTYVGAPADGSAWVTGGDCKNRVARGGSWGTVAGSVRAAARNWNEATNFFTDTGFRLVRDP